MDRTAVFLGGFSVAGIVAIAYAPIDGEGQAIAFTALASLGGAAGGDGSSPCPAIGFAVADDAPSVGAP